MTYYIIYFQLKPSGYTDTGFIRRNSLKACKQFIQDMKESDKIVGYKSTYIITKPLSSKELEGDQ